MAIVLDELDEHIQAAYDVVIEKSYHQGVTFGFVFGSITGALVTLLIQLFLDITNIPG